MRKQNIYADKHRAKSKKALYQKAKGLGSFGYSNNNSLLETKLKHLMHCLNGRKIHLVFSFPNYDRLNDANNQ